MNKASKKKILIDGRAFDKKGSSISIYLYNLTKHLAKYKQYQFYLIVNNKKYKNSFKSDNLEIIYSNIKNNIAWDNLVIPYQALKHQVDLIFYPKTASSIFRLPGKKIVTTIHGMIYKIQPEIHPFWENWYWRAAGKISSIVSDRIIAVSKRDKADLLTEGYSEKKMKIIPIGVNDIFYQDYSKKDVDKVLDKYNLEKNNYFIQIGHITKKKNHIFTLKLIKDKLQKNKKLKIVFIGRKDDKKACKKLTTFINKHNLSNQVIFTGGIDQNKESKTIPVLLQNALIAFFPSTYEGFGIPAVEAMAAATPILVSNRGSLSEVIGEEHTIPLEDTRKWQEQLDLLISDKKQYNIKTEKQKKIANKYRWDNISKEYIKTFNNLL